jgi:U3 small nucleolar RNA-associated protein 14
MPGRKSNQLRSRDEVARKPNQKKRSGNGLNALVIAEDQFPTKSKVRPHRLGEIDDYSKRKRDDTHGSREHETPDTKRRRTDSSESSDNGGSDSEGHEWKIGQVANDDDSDIDSDDALGSSDEERFEGFTFRGSSSKSEPRANKRQNLSRSKVSIDLSEDIADQVASKQDDSEDDLGDDAVDLATAWDLNGDEGEAPVKSSKSKKGAAHDEPSMSDSISEEISSEEVDDDSSEETELSLSDDDNDGDNDGLAKLQSFVNAMEATTAERKSGRVTRGHEKTTPTDYGLTSTRKLTVADLIPSITDVRLKSSLKHLDSATSSKREKSGSLGKLTVPLPQRQQDKLDRVAAYQKSKETLDRWIDTVKANREAEHLSFPLPDLHDQQAPRLGPVKPQTDLESTIQAILAESGLATDEKTVEGQIQAAEELETRKLSLEELQARTAELRKRRDLLFREEVRAKRIKKIKSKSYRRVHRKEREKMDQLERTALAEAGIDLDEEDRERNDRRRAEARMGAKHKESKWAKSVKQTGRAAWDDEARSGMVDVARRDEDLQRRIEGKNVRTGDDDFLGSSSSESEDEVDPWGEEADSDAEVRTLGHDLDALDGENDVAESSAPHSKLLSMKFMQNAEAARKQANDEEIRKLRRELNGDESERDDSEGGRRKFGSTKTGKTNSKATLRQKNELEETLASEDEGSDIVPDDRQKQTIAKHRGIQKTKSAAKAGRSNDSREVLEQENDTATENPWLAQTTRTNRKRNTGKDDQTIDISLEGPQTFTGDLKTVSHKRATRDKKHHQSGPSKQASDDMSDSDDDSAAPILLTNHDLVKKAFAGDEVVEDFEQEKQEVIEDEGDKIVDNTLPGWGSWAGDGISKKQQKRQKRFLTKVEGVKPEQRKDAKLGHVIINEKRVKKVLSVAVLIWF